MKTKLRVLIVEDSEDDARLMVHELERGGFDPQSKRVTTAGEMRDALARQPWDVVLADYSLPDFDAPEALLILQQSGLDIPFIVVSGSIGEDIAVAMMKQGAHDYLLKQNLARLVPAVERELADAEMRQAARRAGDELRASEARFRVFVDHATDAFFLLDENGIIRDANEKASEFLGYPRDELIGMTPRKFDPDVDEAGMKRIKRQLDADEILTFETRYRRKDGTVFPMEVRLRPFWQNGRRFAVALAHDVSARKQMEQTLLDREKQFRALAENLPDNIVRYDRECRRIYVNPAFERTTQLAPEQILGKSPAEFGTAISVVGAAGMSLEDVLRKVIATGQPVIVELIWRNAAGPPAFVECRAVPEFDNSGAVASVLAIGRDVTAQKIAEQRIRQLNRTYAVLSEINQLIVRERDPQTLLDRVCHIAVEIGGFQMAWIGMLGTSGGEKLKVAAHAGADADMLAKLCRDCNAGETCCAAISEAVRAGRHMVCNDQKHDPLHTLWCRQALLPGFHAMASFALVSHGHGIGALNLYSNDPEFFDSQELALLNELAADISYALENCEREQLRLRAEQQLRASEERFREFAENIDEVFWIADAGFDLVDYVSPAYERIWGRSCRSLLEDPKSWLDAVHPNDRESVARAIAESGVSGIFKAEYRLVRPDGEVRWIADHGLPVRDAAGKIERVVGVARDVTENHQLNEQLRQSQKLEAIGQLAGGIAHDFNNILTAILMQADLLAMSPRLVAEELEASREIHKDAERAANLTRQLLLFSRKQMMQTRDLDLNEVVTGLAKMLQRIIGEDVRLQSNLHPAPLPICADAGMLEQVLMNLAVNARDAMPEGGRLTIETTEAVLDDAFVQKHPDAVPGRYACLSVADTGCGIPPEVMPRIFEPFFTTKAPGKGTGLGLATVFGIVKQHQGWIQLNSEPGYGATFKVFLPVGSVIAVDQAATHVKPSGGTEMILVIEDEASVRRAIRALFNRHGYKVVCASDGHEAINVWNENRETISLLLTDLVMPGGMNGQQLAEKLRAEKPNLKVLYMSGYTARAGKEIDIPSSEHFVQKPFHADELLAIVRRTLDE